MLHAMCEILSVITGITSNCLVAESSINGNAVTELTISAPIVPRPDFPEEYTARASFRHEKLAGWRRAQCRPRHAPGDDGKSRGTPARPDGQLVCDVEGISGNKSAIMAIGAMKPYAMMCSPRRIAAGTDMIDEAASRPVDAEIW